MTPAEHIKEIERAVEIYSRDFHVYCDTQALTDFRICSVSLAALQGAIRAGVGAPAQPTLTMKPLQWCDEREPNEHIRYNHVLAESAIGQFSIEWKSWKKYDSRCVYVGGEYIDSGSTLEDAKKIAERHLRNVVEALTTAAPVDAAVQKDAARYRFLRDGNWSDMGLEWYIVLQVGLLWDDKIDAAIAAQQGGTNAS